MSSFHKMPFSFQSWQDANAVTFSFEKKVNSKRITLSHVLRRTRGGDFSYYSISSFSTVFIYVVSADCFSTAFHLEHFFWMQVEKLSFTLTIWYERVDKKIDTNECFVSEAVGRLLGQVEFHFVFLQAKNSTEFFDNGVFNENTTHFLSKI